MLYEVITRIAQSVFGKRDCTTQSRLGAGPQQRQPAVCHGQWPSQSDRIFLPLAAPVDHNTYGQFFVLEAQHAVGTARIAHDRIGA